MKNGEKKILSEKVADMLRTKIINGELQADSRIIESDVAKCMEVSRGPVREALKILEFEGLVTYESNKGCRVTNLSMEDAYEIFFAGQSGNHGSSPGGGKVAGYQPFNHEKLSGGDGARPEG